MGKKSDLKRQVDQSIDRCREQLEPLADALVKMPQIPRMGGQGYYNDQARYLRDNVAPILAEIREHLEAAEQAIRGLGEYVRKSKKKLWKLGASARAQVWQEESQRFVDDVKEALKEVVKFYDGALANCEQTKVEIQRLELN